MLRRLFNKIKVINQPWKATRYVGSDLEGNMYFEGPPVREGISLPRRSIEYADGRSNISQYEPNAIPIQWQAWLRHTRETAPTVQELQDEIARRLYIQKRALEIQEQENALLENERIQQDRLPLTNLESKDATTSNMNHTKSHTDAQQRNPSDDFVPESWQPNTKSISR
ncbi:hypothetical protein BATDEDRAFT_91193 [Batrachochytrium dendrobatidis JAM81]|uniref:NADH dehydrogenase [ubiquinone] 1 alpha subcomplex subunit n=1 Tax=Batrachochytrium dendrobatidis (strain JAM81 / FGSC 10211) TaxID=684364 RepID=F4PAB6_BATDJ|nr:uncharacterized protein BATDEDRAFT_91193 [Batrachochytrium dendrobatidis JAM81]EGF78037.1 hypothetical protein BATDEDRAFT_91193 [Batrachochytrium dendrobatidis JAM81]KAJ8330075.1 hypothetical protein O5D80_001652 [Batrachochytrium dendrobatidis]KAK5670504.1 hypothetical protein QVD99_003184 [Batrachochytrium dendrobatidis]|eukprot:XP_006681555.1 hypothetical protein BATDEDRAFT_91193 [Batrachochytrium dendrobatidis JAM81]